MTTTPDSPDGRSSHRQDIRRHNEQRHARAQQVRDRITAAGIPYPVNWDEMGGSAKGLWEERQLSRLDRRERS